MKELRGPHQITKDREIPAEFQEAVGGGWLDKKIHKGGDTSLEDHLLSTSNLPPHSRLLLEGQIWPWAGELVACPLQPSATEQRFLFGKAENSSLPSSSWSQFSVFVQPP